MYEDSNSSIHSGIDFLTIALYLALVAFGWVNIFAAAYQVDAPIPLFEFSGAYFSTNAGKQLIWIAVSLVAAWFITMLDIRLYSSLAYVAYGAVMLLLFAVLFIGKEIAGARSWIDLGFFRLQPAEFAKIGVALALAKFLSTQNIKVTDSRNALIIGGLIGLPAIFTILQNDTGSALVFSALFIVLYREGLPQSIMIIGLSVIALLAFTLMMQGNMMQLIETMVFGGGAIMLTVALYDMFKSKELRQKKPMFYVLEVLLIASFVTVPLWQETLFDLNMTLLGWLILFALFAYFIHKKSKGVFYVGATAVLCIFLSYGLDAFINNVLKDHQQKRLTVLVDPEIDPRGVGWQVKQSKIAIGSGGIQGKGFLEGTQTKFKFVPDQSTDFIFCTVGEEHGWLGSLAVILLFLALFYRLIHIAERQKARFSRVYGYSVVAILFFHFLINIGMTIGVFPVIGIPLPFFSYGGSSLLAFTTLLFIMLKLDIYRKKDILLND